MGTAGQVPLGEARGREAGHPTTQCLSGPLALFLYIVLLIKTFFLNEGLHCFRGKKVEREVEMVIALLLRKALF